MVQAPVVQTTFACWRICFHHLSISFICFQHFEDRLHGSQIFPLDIFGLWTNNFSHATATADPGLSSISLLRIAGGVSVGELHVPVEFSSFSTHLYNRSHTSKVGAPAISNAASQQAIHDSMTIPSISPISPQHRLTYFKVNPLLAHSKWGSAPSQEYSLKQHGNHTRTPSGSHGGTRSKCQVTSLYQPVLHRKKLPRIHTSAADRFRKVHGLGCTPTYSNWWHLRQVLQVGGPDGLHICTSLKTGGQPLQWNGKTDVERIWRPNRWWNRRASGPCRSGLARPSFANFARSMHRSTHRSVQPFGVQAILEYFRHSSSNIV